MLPGKEYVDNVCTAALVDGNAGVSLLFDLRDGLEVQDGLQGQHVAVLQLCHHILNLHTTTVVILVCKTYHLGIVKLCRHLFQQLFPVKKEKSIFCTF